MMLDIVTIENGKDIGFAVTQVTKAANVLAVQLGELSYAPSFGVDLKFFLESNTEFQNESFKAYLVERLTQSQVNVSQVIETIETFFSGYSFFVGDKTGNNKGLIL